jgi:esterase/lipase
MRPLRFDALVQCALDAHDAIAHCEGNGSGATVIGLSLGAVLGIRVAARRPVRRFIALAPALRPFVLRRAFALIPRVLNQGALARAQFEWQREVLRGIRETVLEIPGVSAPLLVLHSKDDDSVSRRGARLLYERASSREKKLILLEGQGHVLTQAPDPETVFAPVRAFLEE